MTVGNPEVVALLEAYLEAAKTKRFGHVAITMVGHPNIGALDFAGDIALECNQREAVAMLDTKLRRSVDAWTMPAQNKSLDASYVRYNVANGPLGFDFLIWLVSAEMTRVREGAPAPLKVAFWMGHNTHFVVNPARRQGWVDNVFRPLLPYIGAVEDPAAIFGRCNEVFVPREIVAAAKAGEKVPRFKAPIVRDVVPSGYVTITLREAEHGASRNSNLTEWYNAAALLRQRGEEIVFVRDTCKAHEPIAGFRTYPEASINLDVRMALYESAKANLLVANGPLGLLLFGSKPFLSFHKETADGAEENCNTAAFWEKNNGIRIGEQYPWSLPQQRIIWTHDTCDNIVAAWDELEI